MRLSIKFRYVLTVILFSVLAFTTRAEVRLMPAPNSITYRKGHFDLKSSCTLVAASPVARQAASLLNEWLLLSNCKELPVKDQASHNTPSVLITVHSDRTGEKYRLVVTQRHIHLEGSAAGVVRGMSTLLQLVTQAKSANGRIPCLLIDDEPRFAYRGVHLDVCRHFVSKEFVKRYIDLLALHKMNTFHWHLTDDQGWRIEIRKYPRLTTVGAWRNGSMIGPYRDQKFDTLNYGGYYTQEDIREVVDYASARAITVIPEIEMPGHAVAALAAYPQYSCTGNVPEVAKGWGVFDDVFCVNDSTFAFIEDILTEVIALFPSNYIHIGGDECPKTRWKVCPKCTETRYANNLRDEHELQSYFIRRVEQFLNSKGRNIIGWDEILEGGLAPNATVMSWRGVDGGIAAARSGHKAIMTPGSHCYFDHYQGERSTEPLAIGGYTTLEKVYSYRPVPDSLTAEEARFVIGAQANVWTEYMYDEQQVEYMLLPRLCALSEVLWTDTSLHDLRNFYDRLLGHQTLLDSWKVNHSTTWMLPELTVLPGPLSPSLRLELSSKLPQQVEVAWGTPESKPMFMPYKEPLLVSASGTMYVRSTTGDVVKMQNYPFEFSRFTGASVALSLPGDKNYNHPGSTLSDGRVGTLPWTGKQWVGWLGHEPDITLRAGAKTRVDSIVVVCLHDPVSWIHAPAEIKATCGGKEFSVATEARDMGVYRFTIPVQTETDSVTLGIRSIGKIPEGSAGAGEDGWMFVSEVLVY